MVLTLSVWATSLSRSARISLLILSSLFLVNELYHSLSSSSSWAPLFLRICTSDTRSSCPFSVVSGGRVRENFSEATQVRAIPAPTSVNLLFHTTPGTVDAKAKPGDTPSHRRRRRMTGVVLSSTDQLGGTAVDELETERTTTGEKDFSSRRNAANKTRLTTPADAKQFASGDSDLKQAGAVVHTSLAVPSSSLSPQDLQSEARPGLFRPGSLDTLIDGHDTDDESHVPHVVPLGLPPLTAQQPNRSVSFEKALWRRYVKRRDKSIRREAAWKIVQLALSLVLQIMDMYVFVNRDYFDPVVQKMSGGRYTREYIVYRFFSHPLVFLYFLYKNISFLVDTCDWMYSNGFLGPDLRERARRRYRTNSGVFRTKRQKLQASKALSG